MKHIKALESFTVSCAGLRLRVRLYPSTREVHRRFRAGAGRRVKGHVHAFFAPVRRRDAVHEGVIALGGNACLEEVVPHEVTHAVIHQLRTVHAVDDERAATLIGRLSARILVRLRRLGYLR